MASKKIKTQFGEAELFKNNPRTIREGVFEKLAESVENYPQFMKAQRIVVWKVPETLDAAEGEKCPFAGQEGRLIILSGNQRVKVLMANGEGSVPDDWVTEAKTDDGNWWGWRDAEVFLNLANSPLGVAGDFDYGVLQDKFDEFRMSLAGIDFSNFTAAISEGAMDGGISNDDGESAEDRAENDEQIGEKNEELAAFIAEREKTRRDLKEIDETGYHLLLVFPDGFEQKAEWISKSGMFGGAVSVTRDPWIDLVFETADQKYEFIRAAGLEDEDPETGVPPVAYGMFCDGRVLARKMGIALAESGVHNRTPIIDTQLSAMAMEHEEQLSPQEIEERIFRELKKERSELGMDLGSSDGSEKNGKKGKGTKE